MVGQSLPRIDAPGKVTGTPVYAADFALPGMLYGTVCAAGSRTRASCASTPAARRDARRARGHHRRRRPADVRYGGSVKDEEVFARDRIRFAGQPLAAVAATTLEAADAALAAIDVEYEPLPPVFDLAAALAPGAPLVHEGWAGYTALPILHREGNVCNRARIVVGDVERGFEEADRIFEHRFTTRNVHQGYTEPRAAVAQWDSAGQVTVWSNTQLPFEVQSTLAEILAAAALARCASSCRASAAASAASCASASSTSPRCWPGRPAAPVKVMTTSEEELTAAYPRQPAIVELKTGVSRDGRILARQGASLVRHRRLRGLGARRGLGGHADAGRPVPHAEPAASRASPSTPTRRTRLVPRAVGTAGELRRRVADGHHRRRSRHRSARASGCATSCARATRGRPARCSPRSASRSACARRPTRSAGRIDGPAPGRGKGIACGWWTTTGGSSGVYVKINPDGTVALNTGAVEIGTAALTGAAQVLAEELGDRAGRHQRRLGRHAGDAVRLRRAGQPHGVRGRQRLPRRGGRPEDDRSLALAARQLGVEESALALRPGRRDRGRRRPRVRSPTWRAPRRSSGGGLIAHGTFIAPPTPYDTKRVEGHVYPAFHSPSFHAHAVDLSVDEETGEVSIHRYVVAQDVGFAMNPTYIEGQIEGGVAQGLGQALSEEIVYDDGRVLNANLTDYKMPTAAGRAARRDDPRGASEPGGPVRRQGRRRAAEHRAAGRGGQRGGQRHRRADHEPADHGREDRAGAPGAGRG